jgi:predicted metal-dependent phosphoesterase TrpH
MKFLFHIHTRHSYDCILKPESIVKFASAHGIGAIAITDHDTIRGSVEAAAYARVKTPDVHVIIGAEYYTDCGDIIGLFLTDEIREKNASKLIDEIHRQGGIAVLPHPFKNHTVIDEWLQKMDMIETFNPRCSPEQNAKAHDLAVKLGKVGIVGSDAHCSKELPLCYNMIADASTKEQFLLCKKGRTEYTSAMNILYSQAIKGWKKKNLLLIVKTIKSLLSVYLFGPLRRIRSTRAR